VPEWIELYHTHSLEKIAKLYNTNRPTVKAYLISQGIKIKPRGGMNNPNMLKMNEALKK